MGNGCPPPRTPSRGRSASPVVACVLRRSPTGRLRQAISHPPGSAPVSGVHEAKSVDGQKSSICWGLPGAAEAPPRDQAPAWSCRCSARLLPRPQPTHPSLEPRGRAHAQAGAWARGEIREPIGSLIVRRRSAHRVPKMGLHRVPILGTQPITSYLEAPGSRRCAKKHVGCHGTDSEVREAMGGVTRLVAASDCPTSKACQNCACPEPPCQEMPTDPHSPLQGQGLPLEASLRPHRPRGTQGHPREVLRSRLPTSRCASGTTGSRGARALPNPPPHSERPGCLQRWDHPKCSLS
jgi:hypothetical protein